MKRSAADILREYGPFPGVDRVNGVTYDGQHVWIAAGDKLNAFDPANGKTVRSIDVAAHAGTAFDGQHLFQIAEDRIQKIDPKTGRVLATIPAPGGGGGTSAISEGTALPSIRCISVRPQSITTPFGKVPSMSQKVDSGKSAREGFRFYKGKCDAFLF